MTIDQAYSLVSFVANKDQNGNITPAQFNLLAPIMQLSLINDRLGNVKKYKPHDPVPEYGWGITQKMKEEFGALYVSDTVTLTTGVGTQPSDLLYLDTLLTPGSTAKIIEEKTVDEFTRLSDSVIKPPTILYPTFYRAASGTDIFITVSPSSFGSATIFYVQQPPTPVWNYTIVNDEPVYSPSGSQDFTTLATTHLEICQKILAAVGVNLDMAMLEQYAQTEELKGS